MITRPEMSPARHASLHGRGRLTPSVRVRSIGEASAFLVEVTTRLMVLLERRFEGIEQAVVHDVCDAALSRMIVVEPDAKPALFGVVEDISLRFAEAVYGAVRYAHADNDKMQSEWGFSGFYTWFGVIGPEILDAFGPTDS